MVYQFLFAGDVNGDGFPDVIVGADGYNSFTGRAYIYYGGASMNSVADIILTGELTGHNFGYSVSGAGDVNNNGFSDVIIGAGGYNSVTCKAYIFYGESQ
ncbi:MAG: VCBS repeat-containing protein [Ignavibacteria bacterium]|nr:VCBS repeat-containing protein [Ignavibacteria bacterium]